MAAKNQYWHNRKYTVADNQNPPILWPWVFLFGTRQEHLWRLRNAGKHLFRVYWRYWHEPIILKLNIYLFEPPNFGHPPKQLAKNAEKCAIDSFLKLKMIPRILDNFHKPFGWYITSKVTFSHPNIEYLSSHLRLRKFWKCRNSTVRTIQRDLHKLIRLKLDIYIFWPSKIWPTPKQLAKNTEKCAINSFFKSEDDSAKIGQFPRAVRPQ